MRTRLLWTLRNISIWRGCAAKLVWMSFIHWKHIMHSLTNRVYQRKLLQSKIHAIVMVRLSRAGILMFCLRIFPAKKISSAYSYPYRRCWGQVEFPLINQKPGRERRSSVRNWRQAWRLSRSCSFRSFLCHDWLHCCVIETHKLLTENSKLRMLCNLVISWENSREEYLPL